MNKEFLLKYLNTDSPSTFEVEAQRTWIDYVAPYAHKLKTDNFGNAYAVIKKKDRNEPSFKVVIDAHCDEIGWVVSSIDNDGFIRVKRNGGTDNEITPSTNIKIITDNKNENGETIKIKGVFGTTPIHLKDSKDTYKPTVDNIYIDVLASTKEEVSEMGIEIGNYIVFDRQAEILNDKYVIGKSLDDKVGGFIIAEVLRRIVEEKVELPYDLYVVNSVQEEVGLRGAKMITDTIKPDLAICFDVHFDTNTPNIDKGKYGDTKMGNGLIFRSGYDVQPNVLKFMKTVAKKHDYKYNVIVGGAGGTNTAGYNLSNGGVLASTISIPLRYMHTPNEVVLLEDIELTINYFIDLLKNIEYKQNFKIVEVW